MGDCLENSPKNNFSPPSAGGDEGEGEKSFYAPSPPPSPVKGEGIPLEIIIVRG